jgi:hypothetical protein
LLERLAATEVLSNAPITTVLAEAGRNQIAYAAQAVERPKISAHRASEPNQLGK